MLLAVLITLLTLFCYALLMFLLFLGILRLKGPVKAEPVQQQKVTVVIPFRNEADHLQRIIGDLLAQNYPAHLFSVLLVNDHSTDRSREVADSFAGDLSGHVCVDLPRGRSGKKEAIAFALSRVSTPWVLQTDADCRVGPGFISSHLRHMAEHPADLVAGLITSGADRGGFLEAFERLDLLALNGSGAGSFPYGRPVLCSGANLLYSCELYRETRKFDPVGETASGDDMFLLIGARKLNRRISFNPDMDCLVRTAPSGNMVQMIGQRIRWGSKSAFYGMADIQALAVVVALANLLVLVSPLWMISWPESCRWLLPAIGVKMLIDLLILVVTTGKTGQAKTLWWYIPVALVYPIFMAIVIAGSLFGHPSWKGRRI
ncbi:MAG: glycosyltransferase [Bacteroidetes bacterium]|nr:glycosyltransferase [Bacteroidota bacterium]